MPSLALLCCREVSESLSIHTCICLLADRQSMYTSPRMYTHTHSLHRLKRQDNDPSHAARILEFILTKEIDLNATRVEGRRPGGRGGGGLRTQKLEQFTAGIRRRCWTMLIVSDLLLLLLLLLHTLSLPFSLLLILLRAFSLILSAAAWKKKGPHDPPSLSLGFDHLYLSSSSTGYQMGGTPGRQT